jgi:Kef-type K+ transport system membrane component KefB
MLPTFALCVLQIGAMLAIATCCGRLMRWCGQPAVVGELLGGMLLGPTVLGVAWPDAHDALFRSSGQANALRESSIKLGMVVYLLMAALETEVRSMGDVGRRATIVGLVGTLLPIAAGAAIVYAWPTLFTIEAAAVPAVALFIGMNLANSANPVLARILQELRILRSEVGRICMAASVVDDLVNWALFVIVLAQLRPDNAFASVTPASAGIALAGVAAAVVGIRLSHGRTRDRAGADVAPRSGLSIILCVFLAVAAAEAVGLHAFLAAVLVGFGFSALPAVSREMESLFGRAPQTVIAPVYFASLGLATNYATHFDWQLTLVITAAAVVTKVGAVLAGAHLAGMRLDRATLAIASGLNARGATGIILAGLGVSVGLIDERLFVALVVMCMVTSMLAAPAMSALLPRAVVRSLPAVPAQAASGAAVGSAP